MFSNNKFDAIRISLATSEDVSKWSYGEVKRAETINYRTLKPERDGLFCERIFGPTKDWECACGKYKRIRYKGIVCERCGVEITKSNVRRDRMGHITLAAPVTHIWYFRGIPSRIGYLLDLSPKDLEQIIYFKAFIVTKVDDEAILQDRDLLETEIQIERNRLEEKRDQNKDPFAEQEIKRLEQIWAVFNDLHVGKIISDEHVFRQLVARFGTYFSADQGAAAIKTLLEDFDLEAEKEKLEEIIRTSTGTKQLKALSRLKVINAFITSGNKPSSMVIDKLPVIPPDLRPMVQLDGGRFATSDLNDLYRRIISRNNRLQRLLSLGAPDIIIGNEKRMLQESVDALLDNGRRGRAVAGSNNRPLKSLSDMLKGKQGRFRQNLLGKRVDYSGRSVIVVGPQLKLHQCGLPKQMALELFKPFVMKKLIDYQFSQNIRQAKRKVDRGDAEVWDVLEEVIKEHPVLLNRAPTLHRLGIQAFEPQLIEGKAIQLHPLACAAFNADFDGDQMAVHLPLSVEAQAEARILMLSTNNILKPSDGRPVTMPSQDMVYGLFYLTTDDPADIEKNRQKNSDESIKNGDKSSKKKKKVAKNHTEVEEILSFSSPEEAFLAHDRGRIGINTKIRVRFPKLTLLNEEDHSKVIKENFLLTTTLGRIIFNETLPEDYPYINQVVKKSQLSQIVNDLAESYPNVLVANCLDALKDTGFYWATWSGITIGFADIETSPNKKEILASFEAQADEIQELYDMGMIAPQERYRELVDLWTRCTEEVAKDMRDHFSPANSLYRMVDSGSRGNWSQIQQIAGMRGLVTDPKQKLIEEPIKANYREGLTVLEYFIATHGARKGSADTALRTAESGYLTRRLVDVAQDIIVRIEDCGTSEGTKQTVGIFDANGDYQPDSEHHATTIYSRILAKDVIGSDGEVLLEAGENIQDEQVAKLIEHQVEEIEVRSVLTCKAKVGVCANCYGKSLTSNSRVDIGETVGIIAAQSIGEPGTQLTMRTFHTGGAASSGGDITQGLPRVQELFEARTPKGEARLASIAGKVEVNQINEAIVELTITQDGNSNKVKEPKESKVVIPTHQELLVEDGDYVSVGDQLCEGRLDPKEVLRLRGLLEVEKYLVDEVQAIYRSQGVEIHCKHIEIIVRQMLRKIMIVDRGDTSFIPGEVVDFIAYNLENEKVTAEGKKAAEGRRLLLGITKASLATDSWLSAASFQETTRVLTEAAINSKQDPLIGLKENIIIGKLIPAGTGLRLYNEVTVGPSQKALESAGYNPIDYGISDIDAEKFAEEISAV